MIEKSSIVELIRERFEGTSISSLNSICTSPVLETYMLLKTGGSYSTPSLF